MKIPYNVKLLALPFLGAAVARLFVYYVELLTEPTSMHNIKFFVVLGGLVGFGAAFMLFIAYGDTRRD